jgi:hypothetical protein
MTAPVQQMPDEPADPESPGRFRDLESWTVSFVMPRSWTLETLPRPNDSRISLRACLRRPDWFTASA